MNYGEPRQIWSECSNLDFKHLYGEVHTKNGKFCLKEPNRSCIEENIYYHGFTSPKGNTVGSCANPTLTVKSGAGWNQLLKYLVFLSGASVCWNRTTKADKRWALLYLDPMLVQEVLMLVSDDMLKHDGKSTHQFLLCLVWCSWGGKEFDLKCERKSENGQECAKNVCDYKTKFQLCLQMIVTTHHWRYLIMFEYQADLTVMPVSPPPCTFFGKLDPWAQYF